MKTYLNKYFFAHNDDLSHEVASYGENMSAAKRQLATNTAGWHYVRAEKIEYSLAPYVQGLIDSLGSNWDAIPANYEMANCAWYLVRKDGLKIHVVPPCYSHRESYEFSLSAPFHKNQYVQVYGENGSKIAYPSIKLSVTKTAEQAAKDITRRLLVESGRVYGLVMAKIAIETKAENKRLQALTHFCAALGCEIPKDYHTKEPKFSGSMGKIDYEVDYQGEFKLKVAYLNSAEAITVAATIQALAK